LLDGASCGDGSEGEDAKEDRLEEGGGRPKVFANGDVCDRDNCILAKLEAVKAAAKPPLQTLIPSGDFFTDAVLAMALTKLISGLMGW